MFLESMLVFLDYARYEIPRISPHRAGRASSKLHKVLQQPILRASHSYIL